MVGNRNQNHLHTKGYSSYHELKCKVHHVPSTFLLNISRLWPMVLYRLFSLLMDLFIVVSFFVSFRTYFTQALVGYLFYSHDRVFTYLFDTSILVVGSQSWDITLSQMSINLSQKFDANNHCETIHSWCSIPSSMCINLAFLHLSKLAILFTHIVRFATLTRMSIYVCPSLVFRVEVLACIAYWRSQDIWRAKLKGPHEHFESLQVGNT